MKTASKLLRWYSKHGRDLPWRRTRDPYHILVSEIMLQQTQVDRVKLFYRNWLRAFPTWKRLAHASNEEVVRLWSGLGYNRRALVLRDIAKQIVEHGMPQTEEGWRTLKGIGPYTAAAVSAFAQKKWTLPIDTNIRRVLGRLLLGTPYPQPDLDEEIRKRTDAFLPRRGNYFDVPQALFDLATSICTKIPNCATCPLRNDCLSAKQFIEGNVTVPKQMVKKVVEHRHRNKPYPDRIYRGKILGIAKSKPGTPIRLIGLLIDASFEQHLDQQWVEALVQRLKQDGLLRVEKKAILL